jgi:hypothetical protein
MCIKYTMVLHVLTALLCAVLHHRLFPLLPCHPAPCIILPAAAASAASAASAAAPSPWGFGIRACIGSQFALWEAKLFLAVILRCFK